MKAIITKEDFQKEISRRENKRVEYLIEQALKTGDSKYDYLLYRENNASGDYDPSDGEPIEYNNN